MQNKNIDVMALKKLDKEEKEYILSNSLHSI
jgi:hypothetical protein